MEWNEVRCPHCKKAMRYDATICPHCRTDATEAEVAKREQDHKWNFYGCAILAVIAILTLVYCSSGGKEEGVKPAVETAEQRADRLRENCISPWDGSMREMTRILKDKVLNDPDSYEHIETRTTAPDAQGKRQGVTEFRAKNGFGGYVRSSVTFAFDDKACTVSGWEVTE